MNEPHLYNEDYDEKIEKMVRLTVAVARGSAPMGQVALPMAQIASSELAPPEARALARVFTRILNGERDPLALVEDLTPAQAEIVWETLEQIETPLPVPDESGREALSFEELIEKVAAACTGEVMLWQQLWNFTEELATDDRLAPEIRALGDVLRKILAGERQKHVLDGLSDEYRWTVEQLLDWLREQAVKPGDHPDVSFLSE